MQPIKLTVAPLGIIAGAKVVTSGVVNTRSAKAT